MLISINTTNSAHIDYGQEKIGLILELAAWFQRPSFTYKLKPRFLLKRTQLIWSLTLFFSDFITIYTLLYIHAYITVYFPASVQISKAVSFSSKNKKSVLWFRTPAPGFQWLHAAFCSQQVRVMTGSGGRPKPGWHVLCLYPAAPCHCEHMGGDIAIHWLFTNNLSPLPTNWAGPHWTGN